MTNMHMAPPIDMKTAGLRVQSRANLVADHNFHEHRGVWEFSWRTALSLAVLCICSRLNISNSVDNKPATFRFNFG